MIVDATAETQRLVLAAGRVIRGFRLNAIFATDSPNRAALVDLERAVEDLEAKAVPPCVDPRLSTTNEWVRP